MQRYIDELQPAPRPPARRRGHRHRRASSPSSTRPRPRPTPPTRTGWSVTTSSSSSRPSPARRPRFDLGVVLAGETWSGDLTVRRPRRRHVRSPRSRPPRSATADGKVLGAVVVAEDMTEMRDAEAEAAASEQRLRLAHEAAQLGSWHWDIAAGATVWDEQLEAIYGHAAGRLRRHLRGLGGDHPPRRPRRGDGGRPGGARRPLVVRPAQPDVLARRHDAVDRGARQGHHRRRRATRPGTIGCVRDITDRVLVQEQQADAAARALLLQEVTAALVRRLDPRAGRGVRRATSLERVADIVPPAVRAPGARGPRDPRRRRRVRGPHPADALPRGHPAARHARLAVRDRRRARQARGADRRHRRAAAVEPGRQPAAGLRAASSSRRTTRRAATSSSTWAATGTTRCARPTGRWRSSWAT